jgi:hypothetical protein
MRKPGLLLPFLLIGACAKNDVIRPLRPLELATSLYSPTASAALTGSLMYERGCLMFRDGSSTRVMLPIWPDGSVFNGTSVIFH